MGFDNLAYHVLMDIMTYVSIQDRLENVRLVSKTWKSVAEDSLRRERKLTGFGFHPMERKIKPTDRHSIIKVCPCPCRCRSIDRCRAWRNGGMVRYLSHVC